MKVEEHLLWIMDDKKDSDEEEQDVTDRSGTASGQDGRYRHWQEKIKKNIEFVRSLGLSCDSVGWCNLDLNGPDADKLLDQIRAFASREKLYLRGYYSRRFSDFRQEYLIPVALYDTEPAGYYIQPSEPIPYPAADVVRRLASDYEALKQNPRPERKVSEKDALKLLRNIKSLRREDFHKGMAKKQLAAFAATPYERLAPYYAISDGGYLSDEYRFLPYSESVKETQGYAVSLEQEGMPVDRLRGIVIAACADGDLVVVCEDGTVNRISHETMDVYESWDSVAQFFYDTILDDE